MSDAVESDTRARLLAATNELFRRRGYRGTALKDVTALAGATTGSLYHFFPGGKEELAAATLQSSGSAYGDMFELIASAAPDAASAIGALFDGAADVLEATDYIDPCPIGTVAREVANTNESLRLTTSAVFESWTQLATKRFEAAGIEGGEARDLAATIVAALEGGFVIARASRDATVLRRMGSRMRRLVELALIDT